MRGSKEQCRRRNSRQDCRSSSSSTSRRRSGCCCIDGSSSTRCLSHESMNVPRQNAGPLRLVAAAAAALCAAVLCSSLPTGAVAQSSTLPPPLRIDCGSLTPHTDGGVEWVADEYYDSGESFTIVPTTNTGSSSSSAADLDIVEATLRAFPPLNTGCYNVPLANGRYLVRVGLAYRNYDNNSNPPLFNILINGLLVETVYMVAVELEYRRSGYYSDFLVYVSQGSISVCFAPFTGVSLGPPFVNSLEFLPVVPEAYDADTIGTDAILSTFLRINLGGAEVGPEPQDVNHRTWSADVPAEAGNYTVLTTTTHISNVGMVSQPDSIPTSIFQSARQAITTPESSSGGEFETAPVEGESIVLSHLLDPLNPLHLFYVRLYFAEIKAEVRVGERRFDILLGKASIFGSNRSSSDFGFDIVRAANGTTFTGVAQSLFFNYSVYAETYGRQFHVELVPLRGTTLPPIVSAIELYEIIRTPPDGYIHRGLTTSDIIAIVIATLAGACIVGAITWFIVAKYGKNSRRYAVFGTGKHQRLGNGL